MFGIEKLFKFFGRADSRAHVILQRIESKVDLLIEGNRIMTKEVDALSKEVESATSVMASAKTLITGLSDQLKAAAASGDMTQVTAITAKLDSGVSDLAAAIAANTPAAPIADATGTLTDPTVTPAEDTGTASGTPTP